MPNTTTPETRAASTALAPDVRQMTVPELRAFATETRQHLATLPVQDSNRALRERIEERAAFAESRAASLESSSTSVRAADYFRLEGRSVVRSADQAEIDALTPDQLRDLEQQVTEWRKRIAADDAAASWAAGFASERTRPDGPEWRNLDSGEQATIATGESIRKHPVFERASRDGRRELAEANYGSLGEMVRAMATGGTGSALVPISWTGSLIDMARAESAIGKGGASFVPMESGTVRVGRQTGDPSAAFRGEGTAITASDPTFDSVELKSKTMSAYVVSSEEWWQDTPGSGTIVEQALAKAMAAHLDLVALYGGITTGAGTINLPTPDPNPRGVLASLNALRPANILGAAATDGTTPTVAAGYWNEVIDSIFTVRDGNEDPSAIIWSSKLARQYARAVDTTGQPLALPADVAAIPRHIVNRVPSYTKGTMTTATDLFVGDWKQLLVGQRLQITIRPLDQLHAGTGQIGVVASWRGDIALARPSAFAVHRALKGAA